MRPYTHVNVAVSADGKLSTRERRQVKISGSDDFDRVDILKAGSDAIMVGIGTVLADNPSLTVKSEERISSRLSSGRPGHPIRIVVDSRCRIPPDAKILHKGEGRRIIAVSRAADPEVVARIRPYADIITTGDSEVDLIDLLNVFGKEKIQTLMVEGGGTLIGALFQAKLVDELSMFIGAMIIGGRDAPTLADGPGCILEREFAALELVNVRPLDQGVLIHWKVRN